MLRSAFVILCLSLSWPTLQRAAIQESVVAILQEAKSEFSRDPAEISKLIKELEMKDDKDMFEESLLKELIRFKQELLLYPELAQAEKTSSI